MEMPEIRVPFHLFSPSSSIHGHSPRQPNPFAPFLYWFHSVAVRREVRRIYTPYSEGFIYKK